VKIYIAGPIFVKPDSNRKAFASMKAFLVSRGYEVVSPWDLDASHEGECRESTVAGMGGGHTAACYMRSDIRALIECDAVVFLPGWEKSSGSFVEFVITRTLGLKMYFAELNDYVPELETTL